MKISEEIVKNFLKNNSKLEIDDKTKKMVTSFIKQDVMEIFNTDDFDSNIIDIEKIKKEDKTNIVIKYFEKLYYIDEEERRILFKDSDGRIKFSIDFSHPNQVKNVKLEYILDEQHIKIKNIFADNHHEVFNYVEVRQSKDNVKQIGYSLKPIGVKNKGKEYFELTSLYSVPVDEKSLLKRVVSLASSDNIRTLNTSYNMTDLLDYIPEIFDILNDEVEKSKSRAR